MSTAMMVNLKESGVIYVSREAKPDFDIGIVKQSRSTFKNSRSDYE